MLAAQFFAKPAQIQENNHSQNSNTWFHDLPPKSIDESLCRIRSSGAAYNPIADFRHCLLECFVWYVFFGYDRRLPFSVGWCDFFYWKMFSHRIVDMRFAHTAHHSLDLHCDLDHDYHPPWHNFIRSKLVISNLLLIYRIHAILSILLWYFRERCGTVVSLTPLGGKKGRNRVDL